MFSLRCFEKCDVSCTIVPSKLCPPWDGPKIVNQAILQATAFVCWVYVSNMQVLCIYFLDLRFQHVSCVKCESEEDSNLDNI